MTAESTILLASAFTVGFFHTLLGPDHYLPFVAMARAGAWSRKKTLIVTALCGFGHVAGSAILGTVGIALGFSLSSIDALDSSRGSWAAWGLILFGLLYFIWGIRRSRRAEIHAHVHAHADRTLHRHEHSHFTEHIHPHPRANGSRLTPWVLFVIFLLGPREALIPILMFVSTSQDWLMLLVVIATFGIATIVTMLGLVFASLEGIQRISFPWAKQYAHALAGITIVFCGVAIEFIGL